MEKAMFLARLLHRSIMNAYWVHQRACCCTFILVMTIHACYCVAGVMLLTSPACTAQPWCDSFVMLAEVSVCTKTITLRTLFQHGADAGKALS